MKVVDIHPEELIDKLATGELSSAERERLDAHLAQCAGCRFEISVRADLEQEAPIFEDRPQLTFPGPALTERTRPTGSLAPRPALHGTAALKPRSRRRWPLVMLAAALVLCAGGATAAVVSGAVQAPWLRWSPEPNAARVAAQSPVAKAVSKAKRVAPKLSASSAPLEATPVAVDSAMSGFEAPAPSASPALPALTQQSPAAHHAPPQPPALVASSAQRAAVAAFPLAPPLPASSSNTAESDPAPLPSDPAAILFADANRARRDGNADRAVTLYRSLQSRYPSSSESELSRALLAQLLLDRGSPEAALVGFDRYLAEGAPILGAEALVGRARALDQLGRSAQAAAAWKEVQQRFPGSVHARLAATRLAALGMR